VADRIQIRRDTASNWTTADPVLHQGELGIETDTLKVKCGDGSTAWSSLSYLIDTGGYASYADTTANFTGALQKSGVPVAADANLNSFIGAVDLPTSDGSQDQVLQTSGSGVVSWADIASGGTAWSPTQGTTAVAPVVGSGTTAGATRFTSNYYTSVMRQRQTGATNQSQSNVFNCYSALGGETANPYTGGASLGLVITPSTRTAAFSSTWASHWGHTSSNNYNSTQWFYSMPGADAIYMNGNWARPNNPSTYSFSYHYWATSTDTGTYASGTYGTCLHHGNGNYQGIPNDSNSHGYMMAVGYDSTNSNYASYRSLGFGSATINIGSKTAFSNTNTSTCDPYNMYHQIGVYPDSSNDIPVHIAKYGTSNGYWTATMNRSGTVTDNISTNTDTGVYNSMAGFQVVDGSTQYIMDYALSNAMYIPRRWGNYASATAMTTPTYPWKMPFRDKNYGGSFDGIIPTGVENEWICFYNTSNPHLGYPDNSFRKFKINPTTGEFYDTYRVDITGSPAFIGTGVGGMYSIYGLYGDAGTSSTLTHILLVGRYSTGSSNIGQFSATVLDIPTASDWVAL